MVVYQPDYFNSSTVLNYVLEFATSPINCKDVDLVNLLFIVIIFICHPGYFNSNTTKENAGIFKLRLEPLILASLKTDGLIFSGLSKEL